MLRQLLRVPLRLFLPLSEGVAQENTPPAPRSTALLVDLAYSVRLPVEEGGPSRLEAASRTVRRVLREGGTEDEWALLTFSGPGTVRILQPLTRDPRRIERLPLRVGPGARCELRLDPPGPHARPAGKGPSRPWFEIRGQGVEACLAAETPLLVNGVLQRRKVLRPGDRITCGAYRISLDEVVLTPTDSARGRADARASGPGCG